MPVILSAAKDLANLGLDDGNQYRLERDPTCHPGAAKDLANLGLDDGNQYRLERDPTCHPERSEGSGEPDEETQSSRSEPTLREASG